MGNSISGGARGTAGGSVSPLTATNLAAANSTVFTYFGNLVDNDTFAKITSSLPSLSVTADYILIFKVDRPFAFRNTPRFTSVAKTTTPGESYQIVSSIPSSDVDRDSCTFQNCTLYLSPTSKVHDIQLMTDGSLVPFLDLYKSSVQKIFEEVVPVSTVEFSPIPKIQVRATALATQSFLVHVPVKKLEDVIIHYESVRDNKNVCVVYDGVNALSEAHLLKLKDVVEKYSMENSIPVVWTSASLVVNSTSATSFKNKTFSLGATLLRDSVAKVESGKLVPNLDMEAASIGSYVVNKDSAVELFVGLPPLSWEQSIRYDFVHFQVARDDIKIVAILLGNKQPQPKRFVIRLQFDPPEPLLNKIKEHPHIQHIAVGDVHYIHNAYKVEGDELLNMFEDRPLKCSLGAASADVNVYPAFAAPYFQTTKSPFSPIAGLPRRQTVYYVEVPFMAVPAFVNDSRFYIFYRDSCRPEQVRPLIRQMTSKNHSFVFITNALVPGQTAVKVGNLYLYANGLEVAGTQYDQHSTFTITAEKRAVSVVVSANNSKFTGKDIVIYTSGGPTGAATGNGRKYMVLTPEYKFVKAIKDTASFAIDKVPLAVPKISPEDLIQLAGKPRVVMLSPLTTSEAGAFAKFMRTYLKTNDNNFVLVVPVPTGYTDALVIDGISILVFHGPKVQIEQAANSLTIRHKGLPPYIVSSAVTSGDEVSQVFPREDDEMFELSLPFGDTEYDVYSKTPFGNRGSTVVYEEASVPVDPKFVTSVIPTVLHFVGTINDYIRMVKSITSASFPAQVKVLMIIKIDQPQIEWVDLYERTLAYLKPKIPQLVGIPVKKDNIFLFSNQSIGLTNHLITFQPLSIPISISSLGVLEKTISIIPNVPGITTDIDMSITSVTRTIGKSTLQMHEIRPENVDLEITGHITKFLGISSVVHLVDVEDSEICILAKTLATSDHARRLLIVIQLSAEPSDKIKKLENVHVSGTYVILHHTQNKVTSTAKSDYTYVRVEMPDKYYYKFGLGHLSAKFGDSFVKSEKIDFLINQSFGYMFGTHNKIILNERVNICRDFVSFKNTSIEKTPVTEKFNGEPVSVMFMRDVTLNTHSRPTRATGILFISKQNTSNDPVWFEMMHQMYVKYTPIAVVMYNPVIKKESLADTPPLIHFTVGAAVSMANVHILGTYAFYPKPDNVLGDRKSVRYTDFAKSLTIEPIPTVDEVQLTSSGNVYDTSSVGTTTYKVLTHELLYSTSKYKVSFIS